MHTEEEMCVSEMEQIIRESVICEPVIILSNKLAICKT